MENRDQGAGDEFNVLRERLKQIDERDQRLVALLECGTPDRIEHRLRNLIHELQLMRVLVKQEAEEQP